MAIHTAFTSGSGAIPTITCVEDTDIWIPVLLVDKTDGITGETGIAYGVVDVDYSDASTTGLTAYTVTTDDWKEIGEGMYGLRIGASEFTSTGKYFVRIGDTTPNAGKYLVIVDVTSSTSLYSENIPTYSAKKATDTWVPVFLKSKTDAYVGITGVAYGSVDADYAYASATGLTSYSPASADWKEIGEGMYALRIGAGEFANAGRYAIRVVDTAGTACKFFCAVETSDSTIDDLSVNVGNTIPTFTSKLSTDSWIPVRLTSDTDGVTAITGIAHGSIDVDYGLASATALTSYTPGSANWKEMGEGLYAVNIGASEFGAAGRYIIRVVDTGATAMKYACVVETHAASQDDLVRATTPANTLDIDGSGLVDVSKFNGTAVSVDGTSNLLKVDVGAISSDATAANTLEAIIEGSSTLSVDAIKISGDSAAADALELFVETLSTGKLQTGSFVANALNETLFADDFITNAQLATSAVAEIADAIWDEATSGHTTSGTFGEQLKTDVDAILADTGTDGVKIDLAQVLSETPTDTTVGYSLYVMLAHFVHKWTTSSGSSVVYKANGTSTFQSRTITSTEQIEGKS